VTAQLVPGFRHLAGVSCGPTSVRDTLACQGLELSEAMVFGIGAGLGFYYLPSTTGLSRTFFGRNIGMENTFCEVMGLRWVEESESDADAAWERVRAILDRGRPVIVSCDIRHLPHYTSSTSFNGHRMVLAGYDLDRKIAFAADTDRPGIQEVPLDALKTSRASEGPPTGYTGNAWFEIAGEPTRDLSEAVVIAARLNGQQMLEDPSGFGGLEAMAGFAEHLARWPSLRDFKLCAREGYNAVEKRGTGGGFFRALYAEFLDRADELAPGKGFKRLAHQSRQLAWEWSELATAMKLASSDGAWDGMAEHGFRLVEGERALASGLAAI
jgi:hypothetical protein